MKISELMQSAPYTTLLDKLDRHIPERIDRKSKVHDSIITLMERWMQYASISCEELLQTALNHQDHLASYITMKGYTYREPNGGRDNIVHHAPKMNFPIGHIIEYHLISNRTSALLEYMMKIRMPNPRQYTMEIKAIYKKTVPS
ncbi:hypothetical protein [Stenotrophomonas sp.]|uniref:hypothetical protein n=1 Tax=Stenotrophomonas sp. TaxID=69392 RepID=UPI0028B1E83B|nr:hypothetical protein [Stenotrophomonas sp.]